MIFANRTAAVTVFGTPALPTGRVALQRVSSDFFRVLSRSQEGRAARGSARVLGTCAVCMDAPADGVFLPCGHGGTCLACCRASMDLDGVCHFCRARVAGIVALDENRSGVAAGRRV